MSQQKESIAIAQPGQVKNIKGGLEQQVYCKEAPRAEEYLQGKVWGLSDFFESFTCRSTWLPNDLGVIITLPRNSTVGEAWLKMNQYRVLSLPIIEPSTNKPAYVLSMMHILDFLITKYGKREFSADTWKQYMETVLGNPQTGTFGATLDELERSCSYGLDPASVIDQNQTLGQAVKTMLSFGSHRVLVTDDKGHLVNILSQSRVVDLISYLIGSIPKCAKPIEFLGLATKEVISVYDTQTAFEAFCIMREKRVFGLPVVNSENVMIGHISISDLKLAGFQSSYWSTFGLPLKEYLANLHYRPGFPLRSDAFSLLREKGAPELVRTREWHTFGHVIRSLAYFKVHRIYVTDATGSPTGVITMTDVLRELTKSE